MDLDLANQWLSDSLPDWLTALNPRAEKLACTGAVVRISPAEGPDGMVPGAAISALSELAMTVACMGHLKALTPPSLVTHEVQRLRPFKGERFVATATVAKGAGGMLFARAVVLAEPSDRDVAQASGTFQL